MDGSFDVVMYWKKCNGENMLQVYTGNGKGKTTAAIGLAIRALGAGMNIYIMQFMKSLAYSEQKILSNMAPHITLETTGKPFFIAEEGMLTKEQIRSIGNVVIFPKGRPPKEYVEEITAGFRQAATKILSGNYDLAILDELSVALFFGLIERKTVENFLDEVPQETEVVITGRNAPDWLVERADLVTDMREVKHYYANGVAARRGIED